MRLKAKPSLSREIAKVAKAINNYDGFPVAKSALAKIAKRRDALEALAEMRLTERQLQRMIASFAEAVRVKSQFRIVLAKSVAKQGRLKKLGAAVADLQAFVRENAAPVADDFLGSAIVSADEKQVYLEVLYDIGKTIEMERRAAEEAPRRMGGTRKASTKNAAENAAIGWLAASVDRIARRPWHRRSCLLAETLLGIPEVSVDRLRGTLRHFTERKGVPF